MSDEITHQLDLLKKLRQSILQDAITGKLTEQWRQENLDAEPASELLDRIRAEKAKLVQEKKIKKQKPLPSISKDDIPFDIPDTWQWCRLGTTGIFERGKSRHRPRNDESLFEEGTIPFVQTGDVSQSKKNKYLIESCSRFYNSKGLAQSRLWPSGTMCITIAANIAETGFLGIDACFPDSVVGFTELSSGIRAAFVRFFFEVMKSHIEHYAPATAQKNINLGIIEQLSFPCPSYSEQDAIIRKVQKFLEYCQRLESQVLNSKHSANTLMQTVLKDAFETDDEPSGDAAL